MCIRDRLQVLEQAEVLREWTALTQTPHAGLVEKRVQCALEKSTALGNCRNNMKNIILCEKRGF